MKYFKITFKTPEEDAADALTLIDAGASLYTVLDTLKLAGWQMETVIKAEEITAAEAGIK